jgi:hypothetical protein
MLVGGWMAVTVLVEWACLARWTRVAEDRFAGVDFFTGYPGHFAELATYLCLGCSILLVIGKLLLRRPSGDVWLAAWFIMASASLAVSLCAGAYVSSHWMADALPAWSSRLTVLARCEQHRTPACPTSATWNVPGLGEVKARENFTFGGMVVLQRNGSWGNVGYIYAPGHSSRAMDQLYDECVGHLYGPWWRILGGAAGQDCQFRGIPGP